MNSRNLLNLALLGLVAVLVLVVVYEPGIDKPPTPRTLTTLNADAIKRVLIERHDRTRLLFSRENGAWLMREPVVAPVSDYRINAILKVTSTTSQGAFPVEADKLAAYGLAEPRVQITLNDQLTVDLGSNTALDNRRYARVGDTIHLIGDNLYYQLIGAWPTYIDGKPLAGIGPLKSLELPGLRLEKSAGQWLAEPQPPAYSADQAARLIQAWLTANAIEVKAQQKTEGEPVTITPEQGEPRHFLITGRSPDLLLARPDLGIEYILAGEHSQLLQLSPAATTPDEP